MNISKEAREAAADYLVADIGARECDVRKIRQGLRDDDPAVQAIAAAEARGYAKAIEDAARVAETPEATCAPEEFLIRKEIAAAIRALAGKDEA